jgi:hypothetical protein
MAAILVPENEKPVEMREMDINKFHMMTHFGEAHLKATASRLHLNLTGKLEKCIHCARAKAKKVKINKKTEDTATYAGERIVFDVSSCKNKSLRGNYHAFVKIDEFSGKMWCSFHKRKSEVIQEAMTFIKYLESINRLPRFLRCDRSGENLKIKALINEKWPGIQFELTSAGTPQQNGKVERNIAHIWSLMRSYLDATQAPEHIKKALWCEAFSTAMDVWNISSNHKEQPSKEEMWMGEMPKYSKKLRVFGEIGIVKELGVIGHTRNKGYDA